MQGVNLAFKLYEQQAKKKNRHNEFEILHHSSQRNQA